MKGSLRMARLAGIDIDIHWSFSFIILWVILQGAFDNRSIQNIILVLVGVLLVFGCIILHEFGHAFVALSLNVKVKNIVLLPFGGLAQIQAVPDRPWHEFLIAVAGPTVNLAIVFILAPILAMLVNPPLLNQMISSPITIADNMIISFFQHNSMIGLIMLLVVTNLVLFVFNLIPAFPMDGGRILRAFLTLFFPYPRATQMAMVIGFSLAILLVLLAFQRGNVGLFLTAVFILFAARPIRL